MAKRKLCKVDGKAWAALGSDVCRRHGGGRARQAKPSRCRSSVTGQFVSAAYARRYPRLTVKERA